MIQTTKGKIGRYSLIRISTKGKRIYFETDSVDAALKMKIKHGGVIYEQSKYYALERLQSIYKALQCDPEKVDHPELIVWL